MKRLTELRKFSAAALAFAMLLASGCGSSVTASPSVEPSAEPTEDPDPTVIVIPAPEGEEVGLVQDEYNMDGSTMSITWSDCTGDTDVLDLKGICFDGRDMISLDRTWFELVFDAKLPVVFTADKWENGSVTEDEAAADVRVMDRDGFFEQYAGGDRWTWYSRVSLESKAVCRAKFDRWFTRPEDEMPEIPDAALPDLTENGEVCVALPVTEPGIYRCTLYFRESVDNTSEGCTTGDELYSISFKLTVPKSDRDLDMIAVSGREWKQIEGEQKFDTYITVLMRLNYEISSGEAVSLGINGPKCSLEILKDGKWTEVEGGICNRNGAQASFGSRSPNPHEYRGGIEIITPDRESSYRLKLRFRAGVEFNFTINIGWSETADEPAGQL